ncbi:ribonuclease P protein component [Carboxylicivirga sp. RSCT41]|uniref:ribonuclease P protein component n=1 Tax=Carboxylicivirga agarovorans TaxID=3417570 RepID=UPI003D3304B7
MEQQRFTFKKNERLCSRTTIQELFDKGKSFVKYPFRISYMTVDSNEQSDAQILISVSKKRFKRAYKRNRLKRLSREAYRLNKAPLITALQEKNVKLAVAFIYLPGEMLEYTAVEKGMKKALNKLIKELGDER